MSRIGTRVNVLGSVVVSPYVRDGGTVGNKVSVYDSKGNFVASRAYFLSGENNERIAAGKAFSSVTDNGWFVMSVDFERSVWDKGIWHYVVTARSPMCKECKDSGYVVGIDGQDEICECIA